MTTMSHARNQLRDLLSPKIRKLQPPLKSRLDRFRHEAQAGMTTAEYAVGTLAACAFAATLLAIVRSGAIKAALSNLITSALSIAS
jgi:hypothetical protein